MSRWSEEYTSPRLAIAAEITERERELAALSQYMDDLDAEAAEIVRDIEINESELILERKSVGYSFNTQDGFVHVAGQQEEAE